MLRSLQRERGITVLHVTHDVAEGALLGDVVAVLDAGRVLQAGPAPDVFSRPASPRIAELLGAENVFAGEIRESGDGLVALTAGALTIFAVDADVRHADRPTSPATARAVAGAAPVLHDRQVHAVIRADEITLSRNAAPSSARNSFAATVSAISAGGALRRVELDVSGMVMVSVVTARAVEDLELTPGARVTASFKATAVHLC